MGANTTPGYQLLYDIIRRRSSIRKLKSDPIPEEYIEKILEAGRWAMSGANSQPWEYIVVKDPQVKKDLFRAYTEVNAEFIYWMEQQRVFELRHPAYQLTAEKAVEQQRRGAGWSEAPALIVVVGDGRRQWGTVQRALVSRVTVPKLMNLLPSPDIVPMPAAEPSSSVLVAPALLLPPTAPPR